MEWAVVMRSAISDVMETMFFTMLEFDGTHPDDWHAFCQSNIIVTDRDQEVRFHFQASEPFAKSLTANLTGAVEETVAPEELEDTMRELANMVAGNIIAQTPEHEWSLGLPTIGAEAPESNGGLEGMELFVFGEHVGSVQWEVLPTGSQ